ncbi:hypothetical protein yc1106_08006 [Curvularia clavata]|uniref:Uncharacterized protein n=1 Tax=Curvularia clavata TaxID=95742 RepID=A0A9Q8ZEW7_CURCL|nr:hypothetical protein yc1106_08006 [Curvularia clavata]
MRLLKAQSNGSFSLVNFQGKELPPYAILSHTWGADGEEVTYEDLGNNTRQEKVGYKKLDFCKSQAAKDDLHYFWIDTCCIDKSSSAELSEAINSMFNWYRKASKCYVYLSDVSTSDSAQGSIAFSRSRWFTRGWTLQELLAPECVQFFSKEGDLIGDKHSRAEEVSQITNIPIEAVQGPDLSRFSVEQRMLWAENRQTTRKEDQVYSLLGICNICMPLLYGEGEDRARRRMKNLLEESEEIKARKLINIQHWLSAPDPSINYQKALKQRQHNTGLWFLEGERYANWKFGGMSYLWLYGIPGCGKTILSSTIIENITQYCDSHSGYAIAYFYFDFNDVQKQDSERMLRSVIVQLSKQVDDIPPSLDALFSSHGNGRRSPALDELLKALCDMLQQYPEVFIILDALDECTQRPELMEVLEEIASWKISNLHLLMTSRQEQEIKSCLEGFVNPQDNICLQRDAVDEDIQLYIRQRLSDDKSLVKWRNDATLRQEIEDTLTRGSKGMFRWAACQLDALAKCLNRSLLRKALKTLPSTLDETYERILNNIDDEYAEYAIRILQWLAFSERPLSLRQIAEVVAIDTSRDPEFDPEEILEDPLDALKICSSLVTITQSHEYLKNSTQIALAHYSVKEFLVSDRIQRGPAARYGLQAAACHNALTMACLGYLNQFQETGAMLKARLRDSELARYSAEFWYQHARKVGARTAEVDQCALRLFSTDNPAYFNWVRIYDPDSPVVMNRGLSILDIPSPLYYASLLGLENLVSMLLAKGADVNGSGGTQDSALRAAITNGHEGTVRILLEAGANVGPDKQSGGALHYAVDKANCTPSLVSMLLEFGAPTSTIDAKNMTPLHYCVERNYSVVAIQLIDAHVPVDVRVHRTGHRIPPRVGTELHQPIQLTSEGIETGLTPLHLAALAGKVEMTKLLLGYNADPNALSDYHETPLHLAFCSNLPGIRYRDIWNMALLARKFSNYLSKLTWDNEKNLIKGKGSYRFLDVRNVLLGHPRTSSNMRDYLGQNPLHYITYGRPDSANWLRKLVLHGADPTCCNLSQQTPLHFASRAGDHESVKALIDLGAKVGQKDDRGLNALHYAARTGNYETMVVILETEEAEKAGLVASKDRNGKNVLHHLFARSREIPIETVHWLLSQGADSLAVDSFENTPLAILVGYRHQAYDIEIARLLLAVTGTALYSNSNGRNLGHLCAGSRACKLDMIRLLHDHVDLTKKDCEGKTALHIMAIRGPLDARNLEYLVDVVGLRVTDKDKHGRSALQYAIERRHGDVKLSEDLESGDKEGEEDESESLKRMHKLMNPSDGKRKRPFSVYSNEDDDDIAPTKHTFWI